MAHGQSHYASNIISNSHPFHSKWVDPPIPEIQQFQYFTLKIQGQGHGWGQSWKSRHGSNILSIHIPFVPCQSAIPFLRYDFFKIWPSKSKVMVMVEVKVENHKVGVTSLTSLSFHVNRLFQSRDIKFSKFDLENPRWRWNDYDIAQLQVWTIPYNFEWYKSIQQLQRYGFHKVWPKCCLIWQAFLGHGQAHMGQMTMTVHNYRSTSTYNFTELGMEKICQAVTEIWVLQVWQAPARPVTTIHLQPRRLRGKNRTKRMQDVMYMAWRVPNKVYYRPTDMFNHRTLDDTLNCSIILFIHLSLSATVLSFKQPSSVTHNIVLIFIFIFSVCRSLGQLICLQKCCRLQYCG